MREPRNDVRVHIGALEHLIELLWKGDGDTSRLLAYYLSLSWDLAIIMVHMWNSSFCVRRRRMTCRIQVSRVRGDGWWLRRVQWYRVVGDDGERAAMQQRQRSIHRRLASIAWWCDSRGRWGFLRLQSAWRKLSAIGSRWVREGYASDQVPWRSALAGRLSHGCLRLLYRQLIGRFIPRIVIYVLGGLLPHDFYAPCSRSIAIPIHHCECSTKYKSGETLTRVNSVRSVFCLLSNQATLGVISFITKPVELDCHGGSHRARGFPSRWIRSMTRSSRMSQANTFRVTPVYQPSLEYHWVSCDTANC